MITEASLHAITQRVCDLLECSNAFLSLTPSITECYSLHNAFAALQENDLSCLLTHREVRALFSRAMQKRAIQVHNDCTLEFQRVCVRSVAVVPLERPMGIFGFLICVDTQSDKFLHGEYALLEQVIPNIARELEQVYEPAFSTISTQADLIPELQQHYLDILMEQTERMEVLVNRLLDISLTMHKNISTELHYSCERRVSLL